MISRKVVVLNKTGFHARPASLFAETASAFQSAITVTKDGRKGSGKSIVNLLALCIKKDSEITISAEGADEREALDALVQLVEARFNEE
jgi:phosphocarrier protein HPr